MQSLSIHGATTSDRRAAKLQAGFTLLEVMVATVLVGVALISTSWAMASAARVKVEEELGDPVVAQGLAQEIYEIAQLLPAKPSGTYGVTSGASVVALDSLVGASFSPPIRATGNADVGMTAWRQDVGLVVYGLEDLKHATTDSVLTELKKGDKKLYQLSVTVSKDGTAIDTYRWFLTP